MHGGTVGAHSDGPGRGTTLTVRLPVLLSQHAAVASERPRNEAVPVGPQRRILVADDNHDAATSLSLQLELAGHEVRTVFDGAEALEMAEVFRPDVALLDLGMPKVDGYEVARRLRAQPWALGTTLIALTGWGQPQDRARSAAAGFDVHLVKPVAEAELFRALALSSDDGRAEAERTG